MLTPQASVAAKVRQQWDVVGKIGFALHGTLTALLSSLESPPLFEDLHHHDRSRAQFARMRLHSIMSQSDTVRRQYVVLTDHISQLCSFLDQQSSAGLATHDHFDRPRPQLELHPSSSSSLPVLLLDPASDAACSSCEDEPPLLDVEAPDNDDTTSYPSSEEDATLSSNQMVPRAQRRRFDPHDASDLRKSLLQHLTLQRLELQQQEAARPESVPEATWHDGRREGSTPRHVHPSKNGREQYDTSSAEHEPQVCEQEPPVCEQETLKMVVYDSSHKESHEATEIGYCTQSREAPEPLVDLKPVVIEERQAPVVNSRERDRGVSSQQQQTQNSSLSPEATTSTALPADQLLSRPFSTSPASRAPSHSSQPPLDPLRPAASSALSAAAAGLSKQCGTPSLSSPSLGLPTPASPPNHQAVRSLQNPGPSVVTAVGLAPVQSSAVTSPTMSPTSTSPTPAPSAVLSTCALGSGFLAFANKQNVGFAAFSGSSKSGFAAFSSTPAAGFADFSSAQGDSDQSVSVPSKPS